MGVRIRLLPHFRLGDVEMVDMPSAERLYHAHNIIASFDGEQLQSDGPVRVPIAGVGLIASWLQAHGHLVELFHPQTTAPG